MAKVTKQISEQAFREVLTAILIGIFDYKLTKKQSDVVDKQFLLACKAAARHDLRLQFKFTKIKQPKKRIKK